MDIDSSSDDFSTDDSYGVVVANEYPLTTAQARALQRMNLSQFQDFCIGKPKTLFTDNVTADRTMVSWLLNSNSSVLLYAIETLNANVNTTTQQLNIRDWNPKSLHTTYHVIWDQKQFDVIVSSDTLNIQRIEFFYMIVKLSERHGVGFWKRHSYIHDNIITLINICICKKPDYFVDCISIMHYFHYSNSHFIKFLFEYVYGVDMKFHIAMITRHYLEANEYAKLVSENTIRSYRIYNGMFIQGFVNMPEPNEQLDNLWETIGLRLGTDLTLTNVPVGQSDNLLMMLYNYLMSKVSLYNIDGSTNMLSTILSKLTIDWSYVIDHINRSIADKQFARLVEHGMILFTMMRYGFEIPSDEFIFGCFMCVLMRRKTYDTEKTLRVLVDVFKYAGVSVFTSKTLKLFASSIPLYFIVGQTIYPYDGFMWTDVVLRFIPSDAIVDFPDEITAVVSRLRKGINEDDIERYDTNRHRFILRVRRLLKN